MRNASARGYTVVRIALGLLLLVTAILKLSGGSSQVMRAVLPFLSPRLYSVAAVIEAVMGLWLLSGITPVWSWLTSHGTFSFFAYLSYQLGQMGQPSCGCMGKVTINPWWAFAVDVAAMLALLAWRPRQIGDGLRAGIPSLVGGGAIVAVMATGLSLWHGSFRAAMAHVRGETIVAEPAVAHAGEGKAGQFVTVPVRLVNYDQKPIRIVGGTSDCSCIATRDLPISIAPNEERTIQVHVKFTGKPGAFRSRFVLYYDEQHLRVMPISVTGRVVE